MLTKRARFSTISAGSAIESVESKNYWEKMNNPIFKVETKMHKIKSKIVKIHFQKQQLYNNHLAIIKCSSCSNNNHLAIINVLVVPSRSSICTVALCSARIRQQIPFAGVSLSKSIRMLRGKSLQSVIIILLYKKWIMYIFQTCSQE